MLQPSSSANRLAMALALWAVASLCLMLLPGAMGANVAPGQPYCSGSTAADGVPGALPGPFDVYPVLTNWALTLQCDGARGYVCGFNGCPARVCSAQDKWIPSPVGNGSCEKSAVPEKCDPATVNAGMEGSLAPPLNTQLYTTGSVALLCDVSKGYECNNGCPVRTCVNGAWTPGPSSGSCKKTVVETCLASEANAGVEGALALPSLPATYNTFDSGASPVYLKCDNANGYTCSDSGCPERACASGGKWLPAPWGSGTCVKVPVVEETCPGAAATSGVDGALAVSNSNYPVRDNVVLILRCDIHSGYACDKLKGCPKRICSAGGIWKAYSTGYCKKTEAKCDPATVNAGLEGSLAPPLYTGLYATGSVALLCDVSKGYECNNGCPVRTCVNGAWTPGPSSGSCKKVTCPGATANEGVEGAGPAKESAYPRAPAAGVTLECVAGYECDGSSGCPKRVCGAGGKWAAASDSGSCKLRAPDNQEMTHSFFVIGNWGTNANSDQLKVANMMGTLGDTYKPEFVISTGDNFNENGLKKQNDPYFTKTFTNVYTAKSLQVWWYAVLGNHDYGELSRSQVTSCSAPTLAQCPSDCCYSPLWQTTDKTNLMDPRWILSQGSWKDSLLEGQLDIIFIDTTPFNNKYRNLIWANIWGGINSQDTAAEKVKIEAMLAASTARWKVVVGHNPVASYGAHCDLRSRGDCLAMEWLKPWLKQYKVAAYFSGHEHDLQLIKPEGDPVYYVVSGAGSDVKAGEDFSRGGTAVKYAASKLGFVAVSIRGDEMKLDYYTDTTGPDYTATVPRPILTHPCPPIINPFYGRRIRSLLVTGMNKYLTKSTI